MGGGLAEFAAPDRQKTCSHTFEQASRRCFDFRKPYQERELLEFAGVSGRICASYSKMPRTKSETTLSNRMKTVQWKTVQCCTVFGIPVKNSGHPLIRGQIRCSKGEMVEKKQASNSSAIERRGTAEQPCDTHLSSRRVG